VYPGYLTLYLTQTPRKIRTGKSRLEISSRPRLSSTLKGRDKHKAARQDSATAIYKTSLSAVGTDSREARRLPAVTCGMATSNETCNARGCARTHSHTHHTPPPHHTRTRTEIPKLRRGRVGVQADQPHFLRGGVSGREPPIPPKPANFCLSAGFRMRKEHMSDSSTDMMAPALSNSPQ